MRLRAIARLIRSNEETQVPGFVTRLEKPGSPASTRPGVSSKIKEDNVIDTSAPMRRLRLPSVPAILLLIAMIVLCFGWLLWRTRHKVASPAPAPVVSTASRPIAADDSGPTLLYAHNILLRKGPNFRVYILWVRGEMLPTNPRVHPSFDDPESFVLDIQKGVIHANLEDIATYLNAVSPPDAPLKNISLSADGGEIKLHGTLHKIVPLPIEMVGSVSSSPDGHVRFHTVKINVLKLPMKALLGGLHVKIDDLVHSSHIAGTQNHGRRCHLRYDKVATATAYPRPAHIGEGEASGY